MKLIPILGCLGGMFYATTQGDVALFVGCAGLFGALCESARSDEFKERLDALERKIWER